jgi:hypothetical protein
MTKQQERWVKKYERSKEGSTPEELKNAREQMVIVVQPRTKTFKKMSFEKALSSGLVDPDFRYDPPTKKAAFLIDHHPGEKLWAYLIRNTDGEVYWVVDNPGADGLSFDTCRPVKILDKFPLFRKEK